MLSNRLISTIAMALVFFIVTITIENVYASMPVDSTVIFTVTQADGTTFQARAWGDYFSGGYETVPTETVSGYSIVFNEATQNWMYAIHDDEGWLIASTSKVGQAPPPAKPFLHPSKSLINQTKSLESGILPAHTSPKAASIGDEGYLPVILMNFNDTTPKHSADKLNRLLFNKLLLEDGTEDPNHKNLTEYYAEVSYGQFTVSGKVVGWYTAEESHDYYGENGEKGNKDINVGILVEEAIN